MNKIFTILLSILFCTQVFSQSCTPVELPTDTSIIVPPPYDEDSMTGGLIPGCLNTEYEQTLTLKVPEEVDFNGIALGLDSISIEMEGAITGLPVGLTYACNPPNCIFAAEETGCIILTGTIDGSNVEGDYEMSLDITAYTLIGALPLNYPNDIPDVDGSYFISVLAEGSVECVPTVGVQNALNSEIQIANNPNPFSSYTEINIKSSVDKEVTFMVRDLVGNQIKTEAVNLHVGQNIVPFDGSNLPVGMYVYFVSDGKSVLSQKMLIIR